MNSEEINITTLGEPLIKFQSKDRIKDFQKGHLYAKSLSWFRELEKSTNDMTQGDSFEGMIHVQQAFIKNMSTGEEIEINDALLPTENSDDYIFCVFLINPPQGITFSFSEQQKKEMLSFGDTALIVLNHNELINRVKKAANSAGFDCHFERVRYYDSSIDCVRRYLDLFEPKWPMECSVLETKRIFLPTRSSIYFYSPKFSTLY